MNQHLISSAMEDRKIKIAQTVCCSIIKSVLFVLVLLNATYAKSATYYTRGAGGNWGTLTTWSTIGCNGAAATTIPGPADDVIICNSNGASSVTVTVNGNYACNNLTIGTGAANATVQTSNSAYILTIGGTVTYNTGNAAGIYTLNVSSGVCSVAGLVNWNTANGTNRILVSTGTITFSQALAIENANQQFTMSGAGKVYFNGDFSDAQNKLVTFSGCRIYFAGNYSTSSTNSVWNTGAYAHFTGNGKTITATSNITFGYVTIEPGASISNAIGAGNVSIARDLNLLTGATFTVNKTISVLYSLILGTSSALILNDDITIARSWTNNGGTLTHNDKTVTLTGYGYTIGGTTPTAFAGLVIGLPGGTTRVGYTQNVNITCINLTLETNSYANSSAYTLGVSNPTLAVSGNVTVKQLSTARSNSLYVNGGALTVGGNLIFTGTVNTAAQVVQVITTTGSFNLLGDITWLEQTGTALVATEVISVTTGSLTFAKQVVLPRGSGTIRVTGAGTINFNGTVAPSFNLNGAGTGTTNAVFSAAAGSTVNFAAGFTNAVSLTFTAGSFQNFTGTGTITPTGAIRFGHINIGTGATLTLAGAIALQNTWVNNGTFIPSTFVVTFNGSSTTVQSITKTGGETFYGLALTTSSATLKLFNDLTITNSLTMSGHRIDLDGNTLQLGNNAASTLTRTAGTIFNGTFRRYWLASTAITATSGSNYGLFPVGTTTSYRAIAITSTVSPTAGGYISAIHNNLSTVADASYSEGGVAIQRVSNQTTTLATTGIAGGTYSINVTFGNFNSAGTVNDLRLQTNNGGVFSAVGTHASTTGSATAPTCRRTGLNVSQLNNTFAAGTRNKIATPIVAYYYSRGATGNWSNTASWSTIAGGAGASCACVPPAASYVMICAGQTMTLDAAQSVEFITVENGATLDGTANLTINRELYLNGTGKIAPTAGTWSVTDIFINGSSASTSGAALTVTGNINIPANASISMANNLLISGNIHVDGTLDIGNSSTTLNGTGGKTISGSGTINGSAGTLNITSADKSIITGSVLTIQPNISIANNISLTNNGTVSLLGNLTGGNNASTWVNAAGAILNTTGAVLSTGTLTANATPNTVNYNGSGAQTIKTTTYDNLVCANAGTKTIAGNFSVTEAVTIQDAAILNEGTFIISGMADLIMSGNSELILQRTGNGTYPELTGNYNLTGGTVTINQISSNTATLQAADYYNLKLNGSRPYDMTEVSNINSNLDVETSATLTNSANLTVTGILSYTGSGNTILSGNVQAGGIVLTNGTLNDGGNTITITGADGWAKSGGTFVSTGEVVFQGAVAQTISGASSTTFNNLTINNSSSTGVTLQQPVVVTGYLSLEDGYLYTTYTNSLVISDGASASQGLSSSFVDGPMSKVGNEAFVFPIGDYGAIGRAAISAPASPSTRFTAEYRHGSYGNEHDLTLPLKKVSTTEHWLLHRSGSSDAVGITLHWANAAASGISSCSDLRIAHWNGSSWVKEPAYTSGSCTGSGSISTFSGLTNFSPFTFGSEKEQMATNPLPIELLNFTALANTNNVLLNWATATEINNHFFTIQKSLDGVLFTDVVNVEGAGNSNSILTYNATDATPYSGYSYYRLKQTDFDGQFTYSNLVGVDFKLQPVDVIIYPNPLLSGNLKVKLDTEINNGYIDLSVYSLQGVKLFTQTIDVSELQANGFFEVNYPFASGTYILNIKTDFFESRKRLMVFN